MTPAGGPVLMGCANIPDTAGSDVACTTKGIFEGLLTWTDDVTDTAEVGNGCELGFPDVSRDVTTEPLVIGAALGFGNDCVPKSSIALGSAAGGTKVVGKVGSVADKERFGRRMSTATASMMDVVQAGDVEIEWDKLGLKRNGEINLEWNSDVEENFKGRDFRGKLLRTRK